MPNGLRGNMEVGLNQGCVVVVFSKDRAMQLDGTLRSFIDGLDEAGEPHPPIRVLFTTSSAGDEDSYRTLANEYREIDFIREDDFKAQLLGTVRDFTHVLFLVDDNIFIRPCALSRYLDSLKTNPLAIGYSLRLGKNTEYCYALDKNQRSPEFSRVSDETLMYRWSGAQYDFGYPLEVSSSLYRVADIWPLLDQLPYRHPNSLEAMMAQFASQFASIRPDLLCSTESRTFCAPINRVQDVFVNRAGECHGRTAAELLLLFQNGYRLDTRQYRDFSPRGCHEEVPLYTRHCSATDVSTETSW
jgi:hypothetical protein